MREIALTLVICTRDRADRLARCLEAVADVSSSRSWEVVVVDNGSVDGTARVVEEARESFRVPLRLVSEPVAGVSRARNAGWRAAAGPIVAYTDDDCYPASDLVELIIDRFEEDQWLGFLGGAVLLADPDDAAVGVVQLRDPVDIPSGAFVTPGLLISANLAFRREALEAIGGFDSAFGYADAGFAGEDVDAAARASSAGWRGRYDPALVVRHQHGRRPGPDADAVRRAYAVGRGAFYAKSILDPHMRRTYAAGWARLTAARIKRREQLGPVAHELLGAARYLVRSAQGRRRSRLRWSASSEG